MGFQGQLSSVQLADLFQTFFMNRQTGTLSVSEPRGKVHVYFDQGQISASTALPVEGVPFLISTLVQKGLLPPDRAADLHQRLRATGQSLRDIILASGFLAEQDLDEISIWSIEEQVCPLFELPEGDFTFTDGQPLPELLAPDVITLGTARVPTQHIIMEATRRKDEWTRIREIIPDSTTLYVVDNDGRSNLRSIQTDPEMLKVLRYLDGRHTLDSIATAVGATRFDTHAIVAQMILSGVARPQSAQDVVSDAAALQGAGELTKARELLEHALSQTRLPEVMRPLADVCAQLGQAARAVELYLELIQTSQDQGNLELALQDLNIVIGLSPDDPELHFERAQVRAELGQVEEAAAGYAIAAQAFLGTKDVARALDACHRAKNLLPRSPEPHRHLARAYLMEGQTENAVVEYKALWHALLTSLRPTKALDELRSILDADCKFAAIKEQVLHHAQNSEAVKTSKAMRTLVYVIAVAVVIASTVFGWEYYNRVFWRGQGRDQLAKIEQTLPRRMEAVDHQGLIEEVDKLRSRFGSDGELRPAIDDLAAKIKADYAARAEGLLAKGRTLLDGGDFAQSERTFTELATRYAGTKPATVAGAMLEQVRQARITAQVQADLAEANRLWQALDWDAALAVLGKVLDHRDLPNALRSKLTEQQVAWAAANRRAQDLVDRAARIEKTGDLRSAIVAYRRAATGEGDQYVAMARDRLRQLELTYAGQIGKQLETAANAGDEAKAFAAYDELVRAANESTSEAVRIWLASLAIPYTLQVDHPKTVLTIRRSMGDTLVRAPAGTTGVWSHRVTYQPRESVTIIASRSGFANISGSISTAGRRVNGVVHLERGPRWRAELTGPATTQPMIADGQVLVGTARATLEIIDPRQGASRAIVFPDTVAEFKTVPFLFQNRLYAVIEDTLFALDLTTRNHLWKWRDGLTGPVWVQEHDLIQGTSLIVSGASRGAVAIMGADASGHVQRYPFRLDGELTGLPVADHPANRTNLYLPVGNELVVADATEASEQTGPVRLFSVRAAGDFLGRPVRSQVERRPVMLASVATGQVLAIDTDPAVADSRRIVATWIVDGTQPSSPVLDGRVAYVTTAEGRLDALDLDRTRPGQLRWRFPTQGSMGGTPGEVAVGQRGVYVATANGVLFCVDRATGAERWHCDLGTPAFSSIAASNGMVFVTLRSGQVLGFDEGDE